MTKRRSSLSDEQITTLITQFESDISDKEAEESIAQLKKAGNQVINLLLARLESPDPTKRRAGVKLAPHLASSRAIRKMKRLLTDRRLRDEHRLDILDALQKLGVGIDMDDLIGSLRDPSLMQNHVFTSMLDAISSAVALSVFVSTTDEQMPPEIQSLYLTELSRLGDKRAVPMLQCFLWSDHDKVILTAIAGLGMLGDPAAIPALGDLIEYGHSEAVRAEARRVLGRLVMRASVQEDQPPADHPLPLVETLLSAIDGNGTQICLITRWTPDGDLTVTSFLFNDHQGLKDCFVFEMDEDSVEDMLDEMSLADIGLVDASLGRCREMVAAARKLALKTGRGLPLLFHAALPTLDGLDTRNLEETPLPAVNIHSDGQLLKESTELLELEDFESWMFNPDDWPGYDEAIEVLGKASSKQKKARLEKLITQGLEALMDDEFRQLLRERLMRQAWVLAQMYNDDCQSAGWAVAAARALEDDSPIPVTEHPLLRDMMRLTFTVPPDYSNFASLEEDWPDFGPGSWIGNLIDQMGEYDDEDWSGE